MKATKAPDALAKREAEIEPWRNADWQKLWLSLKARTWSSLAVVPAGPGGPSNFTLTIAVTLARIGIVHLGTPVHVADATSIPLTHLEQFTDEVRRVKQEGELVLIALAPSAENPITVSLAQAADAAVLCVLMNRMSLSQSKQTVERIGAGRFVGSAVFHNAPEAPK
jgi:hypothetical protein